MLRLLALALVPFLLTPTDATAQKLGSVPKVAPTAAAPKGEVLEWTSAAGRPFWYRLPKKSKGKPALILMLHGTGGNHGWSFWNYPIAGNGNFRADDIVVSPDGVTPGGGNTFNFVQGDRDGDQLVQIIKSFQSAFDIGKVYVYGHSQGAFFCYWFAGAHPEIVDGIVAHAGNVLSVRHPKLAKRKVGIAILHGKADAVVSVECAHRTHDIYKEQGYTRLRLEIVEGLTERSGHWPLPKQVGELLDWLDSVTADTAPAAIGAALSEIRKEQPDLTTIAASSAKANELLPKHKDDDRELLQERAAAIDAFLEKAAESHAKALEEAGADAKTKVFVPWIEHFRIAHAAFEEHKAWQDRFRQLASRARKDEKRAAKALQALSKKWDKKAFKTAEAALDKAMLAPSRTELANAFGRSLKQRTKGIDGEDTARAERTISDQATAAMAGAKAAAAITAELAAKFREQHPDWFSE